MEYVGYNLLTKRNIPIWAIWAVFFSKSPLRRLRERLREATKQVKLRERLREAASRRGRLRGSFGIPK